MKAHEKNSTKKRIFRKPKKRRQRKYSQMNYGHKLALCSYLLQPLWMMRQRLWLQRTLLMLLYSNSVKTDIYLQTKISRDGGTDVCINRKKIIELQQINANDTTKMTTIIISATVLHCKKIIEHFQKLRIHILRKIIKNQ